VGRWHSDRLFLRHHQVDVEGFLKNPLKNAVNAKSTLSPTIQKKE
jgi:hypothetical protein